ncbi:MAG TPA: hypothetical protein VGF19_00235 [Candidatus Acidoferrum sp.]
MLSKLTLAFLLFLLAPQTPPPRRAVQNNTVISDREPAVQIQLPISAKYVGEDHFVLLGFDNCDLFAFVDTDAHRRVQHLYWIQFEAYSPSKPDAHHQYASPRHTPIANMDFYVDTWLRANSEPATPGSDLDHLNALLRANGYITPPAMMSVRLVHTLDDNRKELMIIYSEDIAPTGFTLQDLQTGSAAHTKWPAIEQALINRAKQKIAIH